MAFERSGQARGAAAGRSWGGPKDAVKPLAAIGGRWTEDELVAMIPDLLAANDGYVAYAGIGSRETPELICDDMTAIASVLEARGFTLRSGFAGGADTAFELGTTKDGQREIFAPWKGFGANPNSPHEKKRWDQIRRHEAATGKPFSPAKARLFDGAIAAKAEKLASRHHPEWEMLGNGPRMLHSRNMGQVLGPALTAPARFEIAYTPDGAASGGTGQAIRVAESEGIPVLNVRRPAIRDAVLSALGIEKRQELGMDASRAQTSMDFARDAARDRGQPKTQSQVAQSVHAGEPKAFDLSIPRSRSWEQASSSVFCKVREEHGDLSNMSNEHGYTDHGVFWKSSEAQFQAMRFPEHPEIQEAIRQAPHAMAAKAVAREHIDKTRPDWNEVNVEAMAYVITRKHDGSARYRDALARARAGGRAIVELSTKSDFWGAAPRGPVLVGQNVLGVLSNQLADGARQDTVPRGTWLLGMDRPASAGRPERQEPVGRGGVTYVRGDVSADGADVIVNTVNAQLSQYGNPVMGKGVALAFKERFPSIMRDYKAAIVSGELKPGRALLFDLPDGRKWAALVTKDHYSNPSRMDWVEKGLKELAQKVEAAGARSVAIPPPGCGNGGLDWAKVEPKLLEALKGVELRVYAEPSGAAQRPVEMSRPQAGAGSADRAGVPAAPAAPRPVFNSSMYFSYGRARREGVEAATTFEAILSGERTSTTRFDNWSGSDRWGRLKEGEVVRFFEDKEMKGRSVDVRISGVERIDLRTASDARIEEWSKAEGWSPEAGRQYGQKNQPGWQVRYEPVPGQEILRQRERAPAEAPRQAALDLPQPARESVRQEAPVSDADFLLQMSARRQRGAGR